MAELKTVTVGKVITILGNDGVDFRTLLSDALGRPIMLAGSDGLAYKVLKTNASGQLQVVIVGTVPDADTVDLHHAADFVLKAGDTMTGALVLPADPDADMKAATKQYVDSVAGGYGTLVKTLWSADAPPVSAGSLDDEFADNSFDTVKWTEFDVPGLLTITEDNLGAKLLQVTAAANHNCGAFKLVPDADWTIWARVAFAGNAQNYGCAGLLIGQDIVSDPATSDIITLYLQLSTGESAINATYWTKYDTFSAHYGQWHSMNPVSYIYLRARRIGNTLLFDFSTDGQGWVQFCSAGQPWIPKNVGISTNNANTGVSIVGRYQFFRYVASGLNTRTNTQGRLVKMFA